MVNNIMVCYMLVIGRYTCALYASNSMKKNTLTERERITVLCSRCWCCRRSAAFSVVYCVETILSIDLRLDASKKVDAPTPELDWPFSIRNVSVNALFHTQNYAMHFHCRIWTNTLLHLAGWLRRWNVLIHISFGKYFSFSFL